MKYNIAVETSKKKQQPRNTQVKLYIIWGNVFSYFSPLVQETSADFRDSVNNILMATLSVYI